MITYTHTKTRYLNTLIVLLLGILALNAPIRAQQSDDSDNTQDNNAAASVSPKKAASKSQNASSSKKVAVPTISDGEGNYDPDKDQGQEAVIDAARQKPARVQSGLSEDQFPATAKNALTKKLSDCGIKSSWDNTKCRMAGVATFSFPMDGTDIEEYMLLRQVAALGAMVSAQAELAKWMGTKADMSVTINNPGDPFKLQNDDKLETIKSKKAQAKAKVEKAGIILTKSEESALAGVTTSDRIKVVEDALIKKIDTNYNSAQIPDKKQSLAKDALLELQTAKDELATLENDFSNYKTLYRKREVEASSKLTYDHYIFGMNALFWAENVTPGPESQLQMAVAYVWSPKLAQSAYAALMGDPSLEPEISAKGDLPLADWLNQQDLTTFGAFRYYVDDQGERWYLGASARAGGDDDASDAASMSAIMNLYMPLSSKLIGFEEQKIKVWNGKKGSSAKEDLAKMLESIAHPNTRGLNKVVNRDIWWPAKGMEGNKDGRVQAAIAVYALAASSGAAALKAEVENALKLAQIQRENNRRWMEHEQSNAIVDNAKKESLPSRVPKLVKDQQKQKGKAAIEDEQESEPVAAPQKSKGKMTAKPGVRVTPGKVKDDF